MLSVGNTIPAGHYLLFGRLERPKEGSKDINFKTIHDQVGGRKIVKIFSLFL